MRAHPRDPEPPETRVGTSVRCRFRIRVGARDRRDRSGARQLEPRVGRLCARSWRTCREGVEHRLVLPGAYVVCRATREVVTEGREGLLDGIVRHRTVVLADQAAPSRTGPPGVRGRAVFQLRKTHARPRRRRRWRGIAAPRSLSEARDLAQLAERRQQTIDLREAFVVRARSAEARSFAPRPAIATDTLSRLAMGDLMGIPPERGSRTRRWEPGACAATRVRWAGGSRRRRVADRTPP